MSFVHGGFHDTCLAYEVITASGDVVTLAPDDLAFQMMHGSFGTLGILSKLTFSLVPALPYVHVVYETHRTIEAYTAAIRHHASARDVDFMDGIIHGPSHFVLSVARFVATAPFTHRYDRLRVYWESTAKRQDDYLTTKDYLFRYNRGVTNVRPRSLIGRLLLGPVMQSTQWLTLGDKFHWLLRTDKPTVTVDLFLPISRAADFLSWWDREFAFYPLWCVPYRRVRDYEWLVPSFWTNLHDDMFLDLAVYGMRQHGPRNAHKMIEDKLRELNGIKTLIAHNYYTEAEFWAIWNKPNYDAVKQRTDPDNRFRDVFTKTCRAAMGLR
jgi:FAD/FMN-containing dehydrogenase